MKEAQEEKAVDFQAVMLVRTYGIIMPLGNNGIIEYICDLNLQGIPREESQGRRDLTRPKTAPLAAC